MRRIWQSLTTRGRAFVSAGLTLVICGYALGMRDLTRIGVLLVALPLLAGLLARRRPGQLLVARDIDPATVTAGDRAEILTRITNTARRSTAILLGQERLDPSLGSSPRALLGSLAPDAARGIRYVVQPPVRGRIRLGPLAVQLRDPFGLTARYVDVGEPSEVLVLPRVVPLDGGRPRGTGIGADGEIPFMIALHGEDDQSIREYRDGDDLRRIHWPATARTGDLMVRQEDRPARRRAVVLIDARAGAHAGTGRASTLEWAVTAAASVTAHLMERGYATHLVTPETVADAVADLPVGLDDALAALAVLQPSSGQSLADQVRAAQSLLGSGGLLVAVLGACDDDTIRTIAPLRSPGSAALALIVTRAGDPAAATTADVVRAGGWRAVAVTPDTPVAQAWREISSPGVLAR